MQEKKWSFTLCRINKFSRNQEIRLCGFILFWSNSEMGKRMEFCFILFLWRVLGMEYLPIFFLIWVEDKQPSKTLLFLTTWLLQCLPTVVMLRDRWKVNALKNVFVTDITTVVSDQSKAWVYFGRQNSDYASLCTLSWLSLSYRRKQGQD